VLCPDLGFARCELHIFVGMATADRWPGGGGRPWRKMAARRWVDDDALAGGRCVLVVSTQADGLARGDASAAD
jgi:hypothetical protein